MGNPKQKWSQEEEDALIAGVEKHGTGKWRNILLDPQFAPLLISRTNVDLKDKWRNLNVSSSSRVPRLKAAAPLTHQAAPSEVAVSDSSQSDQDVKNHPRYNAMIFEALSTLKDANGSDLNAIVSFIKEKDQVPENFRRELTTRLRGLVNQGVLEKIRGCYKIKKEASLGTKPPSPKQKDARPQRKSPVSGVMVSNDPKKEAADTAAYSVANAENKSYLAAEAVKEMERISLMAEENDLMQRLAMDYYRQCARGAVLYSL